MIARGWNYLRTWHGARSNACAKAVENGEAPPLELEILEKEELSGDLGPRHFHVKAWGEEMHGTVVDLPCRVESHILPPGASQALYKSADVAQMLIVHRENEVPGAERYLDKKTFRWRSGLTPPTQLVVDRRFRGVPPSHSMFAPALIRETNAALKSRMANHPFTYEEEGEVDEAFCENIRKEDPQSVWRPPEGLAGSGPSKAPGHASAASPARPNHRASPGPASVLSQKGHASAASPARPNHRASPGPASVLSQKGHASAASPARHRASPGPASVLSQKGAASEVSARSDANTEGKAVKKLKITAKKK
ncbi:unnamed protein product [Cladocopium goreaui]|uniref:TAFII55 protein conserved region domain-containing protein n=1 Tax=Cladocopium goreaui TaxID=2562237 RepID=A0A9P1GE93_9DINO|nr:unnamed protein product [Cladocopium goreaui]